MIDIPLPLAWIWGVVWLIVKMAIFMAISRALAPKPPGAKPASASEFSVPTATEGRIIPILFGRRKMDGPNIIWYGGIRAKKIEEWADKWFNKKVTVGYKYFMSWHMIFSHCVDCVSQVWSGDKVAWPVALDSTQENTTGVTSISLNLPNLYGGDKREGGISGDIDIQYGASDQTLNPFLLSTLGPDQGAYRYQTGVIFKNFYIGNSPYPRPVSVMARRTQILTNGDPQWYLAKAEIGDGDMNPIHIIHECLTNPDWGMGESSSSLGSSFESCADQLFTEGFGLSCIWDASCTIQEFISEMLSHIDAVLYVDYTTDKFEIKLLRQVDPSGLDVYNESQIISLEYDTTTVSEVVNKVVVQYADLTNTSTMKTATAIDNSLVERQGGIEIEKMMEFPAITNDVLANKVAYRELRRFSAFLPPYTLKCNRMMSMKLPGDVFKISFATRGIVEVPIRVLSINLGTPSSSIVTIKAVRDVFADGVPVTNDNIPSSWTAPHSTPVDATFRAAVECPFWFLARGRLGYDGVIAGYATDHCKMFGLAGRPVDSTLGFEMMISDGAGLDYYEDGTGDWSATATIISSINVGGVSITISLQNVIDLDTVPTGTIAQIGDELFLVESVNTSLNQVTLSRGVLDTIPMAHTSGDRIWFYGESLNVAWTAYKTGDAPSIKFLTIATDGTLDLASATATTVASMNQRIARPYPPANFKINTVSFAATFTGQPTLSWSHRSRREVNRVLAHDSATNSLLETGQTYTLEIYDEDNNLVRTETGLSGTSYNYTEANERADCGLGLGDPLNTQLRFKLWSVRDGLTSLAVYDHVAERV